MNVATAHRLDDVLPTAAPVDAPVLRRDHPAVPPEARLEMPVQSLNEWTATSKHGNEAPAASGRPWLSLLLVFGGAIALTGYGAFEMYQVITVAGTTTFLQWILLGLFTVNFSWIALAFTSAVLGFFVLLAQGNRRPPMPEKLTSRTAVVMPVYNEGTARVFAALEAMHASIEETGHGAAFDYFILSDSTRPDAWIAEERAFLHLRERLGGDARVYYRHRLKNTHRKAGNIADFVTRWGGAYDHMLVLDADSVMTGKCIVRLAAAMEADPRAGIIQTLPLIINRNTLFARLQQFAARLYGPVIAVGLSAWSGREGNYWGHNAIIRTRAFAENCGLPDLKGAPPFGGHVLSHDFVEAALMLRAGYAVYMLPHLRGSYEESPPSLIDVAVRDRRWCQGNLQHLRIIGAKGLRLASRQHFATGVMSYLASPFWLGQLVVGIALVLQTSYFRPEYFTTEFTLFPTWPTFDPERALWLFGVTMAILLAPKFLGLILALTHRRVRRFSGGAILMTLSAIIEIILSALIAPIMMLIQSGSVFQILLGRDTGWNPQRRGDGSIPLAGIVQRHRVHMALGIIAGIAAFTISTSLFAWMSPTILGLLLAIPLSWATAQLALGIGFRRFGLLRTPEETAPPDVVIHTNRLARELETLGFDDEDGLAVLHRDPELMRRHQDMLPTFAPRGRGQVSAPHAVAVAKLTEAAHIGDALAWLAPAERMAVLQDRGLLAMLGALPSAPSSA